MVPTSSQIIVQALGMQPDGAPAEEPGLCAYCGTPIRVGDLTTAFSAGPAFMDDLSLAARGSKMVCGCCSVLLSADALKVTGHGAFSQEDGALPFRKWADITAALSNPPRPPFVMVRATANNQHMAWRAPVNLSRDLLYVRVGLRNLKIRRPVLLEAVEASQRIARAVDIVPTAKSLAHPFARLTSDLKVDGSPDHATLRLRDEQINALELSHPADMATLRNLTLGETWALRFLLSPAAGTTADNA